MNLQARPIITYKWQMPMRTWEQEPKQAVHSISRMYIIAKRGMDIIVSSMVILSLVSWLLPMLAILIVIESKGMPIFSQKRTGKNGKTFTCYKLRTMKPNALADVKQATDDDERITKIGQFLRLSSLDELPQFFNVLKGDMSLVGPRPHMIYHTEYYQPQIKDYQLRHLVKPGITGLAQVEGFRGPTKELADMENRVKADLYYISHQTFSMDWKIVKATFKEVSKALWRN